MAIKNPFKSVEKDSDVFNLYLEKYVEIEKYMLSSKKEQEELKNLIVSFINQYVNNQEKINDINSKFIEMLENINEENSNNKELLNNLDGSIEKLSEDNNSLNTQVIESINELANNQLTEIKSMNETINNGFKKFNDNFENSMKIIENHYENCRKYFFNGTEDLLKKNTNTDLLFNFCYFNNIELLSYAPEENTLLFKTNDGIIFSTNNHIYTLMEIYGLNEYMLPIFYKFDDFIVFDIGMNRAYAALKFANFNNCSAVYGFEIDKATYDKAVDNILLNPHLSNKIETFNFGLSDVDEIVDLYYYDGFDGLNTMMPEFLESGSALHRYKNKVDVKKVEVKKASDTILSILSENNIQSKVVLKIDTEGAEYKIINDLISSGIIEKVDVIIGEGHIFSGNEFKEDLLNLGFKIVRLDMDEATYDFAFVREEYFNYWPLFQP